MPNPLAEQSPDFEFDIDNREAAKQRRLDDHQTRDQLALVTPKEGEDQRRQLFQEDWMEEQNWEDRGGTIQRDS